MTTRTLIAWICLLALHGSALSQPLGDAYWNRIIERADSVVISRFGAAFFNDHIFPPIDPLDYVLVDGSSISWADRDTITRAPTHCYFEYDIGFDTLNASRLNISFSITPDGHLVEDADLRGFVDHGPPIAFHTDLSGFIELARSNGVRCARKSAFRDLEWIPSDTAAQVNLGGVGRYELVLGRIRGKKKVRVPFSTHYDQIVDVIIFDPFTGAILRKEQRRESLGWACGRLL